MFENYYQMFVLVFVFFFLLQDLVCALNFNRLFCFGFSFNGPNLCTVYTQRADVYFFFFSQFRLSVFYFYYLLFVKIMNYLFNVNVFSLSVVNSFDLLYEKWFFFTWKWFWYLIKLLIVEVYSNKLKCSQSFFN